MARELRQSTRVTCDAVGCDQSLKLPYGARLADYDWGIIRLYDGNHDPNCIGDQNGWNNFDLCEKHYRDMFSVVGCAPEYVPAESDESHR